MFSGDLSRGASRGAAWFDSLVFDHSFLRLGWSNFGTVIPGRLYRANHPTPARLARLARRYGLRTLINLRGHRPCGSDALSREAARQLGLVHIDIAFESRGAPHRDRILRFAEIYRTMEAPALMHCKSGADRTGLAAGLALLLEGGTAAEAAAQLSLRHLHLKRSSTGILDAFFAVYAREAEGRVPFLDWVADGYDEAGLRAGFHAHGLGAFVTDRILHRE